MPTKKRIVRLAAVIAAIALFVLTFGIAILLLMFGTDMIRQVFPVVMLLMLGTAFITLLLPVLVILPVSSVLLLTFVGFGALTAWAFYKRDLKPVLFPGSFLVLPALLAAILIVFFSSLKFYFNIFAFFPISALMLSIFVGLGAIVISASYRQDLKRVLKLIRFTFGAIVLSIFFLLGVFVVNVLLALPFDFPPLAAGLVVVYLYWPGRKHGLFLRAFGAVLALELALLLTMKLVV